MISKVTKNYAAAPTQRSGQKRAPDTKFELAKGASQKTDTSPESLIPKAIKKSASEMNRQRNEIDRFIRQARRGAEFSAGQLLAMQAKVGSYSNTVELVSRATDKSVSTLKTLLQTPV